MTKQNAIKVFEEKKVRTVWDSDKEEWYFSIVDVIAVLTDSPNPRKYWSVLKTRLKKEGSELTTNCSQLKMQSSDGKFYKTDVADVEQLSRLIRSIPSPKAEPFKLLFLCRNKSSGWLSWDVNTWRRSTIRNRVSNVCSNTTTVKAIPTVGSINDSNPSKFARN